MGVGLIIGLVFGTTLYVWNSERFNKTQRIVLSVFILFPPLQWASILLILIYNYFINQSKPQVKLNSAKEDLTELKNKGIITEEVYNEKISKIDEKISKEDILETKEYKQLKRLFDSGIFTKEEFENKIDILKNKVSVDIDYKEFRIVDGFSEGLAVAINNTLDYGYVNEENEVVIDFVFEHAENFKNGIAKVRINREFKNIDLTGNVII